MALAEACKELQWLLKLMADVGEEVKLPVVINEDNQSCISILHKEGENRRTKHIDTRYNYVRDLNANGTICVRYCPTDSMVADALTKPLTRVKLEKLRAALGLGFFEFEDE